MQPGCRTVIIDHNFDLRSLQVVESRLVFVVTTEGECDCGRVSGYVSFRTVIFRVGDLIGARASTLQSGLGRRRRR
jgi:hypothetical protein